MIPKSELLTPLFLLSCEQITNEFKFPIAAFHHAHETYLVPDTLKSAYGEPVVFSEQSLQQSTNASDSGHPPAAALFATHGRYKREAYRGSEFAPRILAENGLQVVLKVRPTTRLTLTRPHRRNPTS